MPVSTAKKRLIVERQYALFSLGTFATFLAALQDAAFKVADAGKAGSVAAVTAGDRSTSFSNSDHGDTPADTEQMWGELLELYDACNAALIASGIATPTDEQRKTEMVDRLRAVREFTGNYTGIRT